MKSSYSCMYLVPIEIYEKLLDCLDSKDVKIVGDLNRAVIGNDDGAFPNLPPPPPGYPFPFMPFGLGDGGSDGGSEMGGGPDNDTLLNPVPGTSGHLPLPDSTTQSAEASSNILPHSSVPTIAEQVTKASGNNLPLASSTLAGSLRRDGEIVVRPGRSLVNVNLPNAFPSRLDDQGVVSTTSLNSNTQNGQLMEGYVCRFCGARLASPDDLIQHIREKHRNYFSKQIDVPNTNVFSTQVQANMANMAADVMEVDNSDRRDEVFNFSARPTNPKQPEQVPEKSKRKGRKKGGDNESSVPAKRTADSTTAEIWSKKSKRGDSKGSEGDSEIIIPNHETLDNYDDIAVAVEICSLCDAEFDRKSSLLRHIKNIHGADVNYSQIKTQGIKRKELASASEPSPKALKKHKGESFLHRCPLCTFVFVKEEALFRHVKNVHGADKNMRQIAPQGQKRKLYNYSCFICSHVFKSQKDLDRHMTLSHKPANNGGKSKIPCQFCSKIFGSQKMLNNHLSLSHKHDVKKNGKEVKANYKKWSK